MASAYPTSLDTLATNKADGTATVTDHAAHHNDLADAINKVEAELGADPSGTSYSTLKGRVADAELGATAWRDIGRHFGPLAIAGGATANTYLLRPNAGDILAAANSANGEYDNRHPEASWASDVAGYQRSLYSAVRGNSALDGVPVVGPSLVKAGSYDQLGRLDSDGLDIGNVHPYTGALPPDPTILTTEATKEAKVAGPKPTWATEAGFHNSLSATTGQPGASESAAAVYVLRTYLEHFLFGLDRTYVYELLDEKPNLPADPEQHFGLLRVFFGEKPAFTALKNLLALVGRPAQVSSLQPFDYTLGGDTTGVRQLLLQSADRSYQLFLWQSASVWDRTLKQPIAVNPKTVTVGGLPTNGSVALSRPLQSAARSSLAMSSGVVSVDVPADPVLLDIAAVPRGRPLRARRAERRR